MGRITTSVFEWEQNENHRKVEMLSVYVRVGAFSIE
jgi:hypothetical protein